MPRRSWLRSRRSIRGCWRWAAYPPAGDHLRVAAGAVLPLIADLSDLARLEAIGVSAWLERYQADLAQLSAASGLVRQDLGLPALLSPTL